MITPLCIALSLFLVQVYPNVRLDLYFHFLASYLYHGNGHDIRLDLSCKVNQICWNFWLSFWHFYRCDGFIAQINWLGRLDTWHKAYCDSNVVSSKFSKSLHSAWYVANSILIKTIFIAVTKNIMEQNTLGFFSKVLHSLGRWRMSGKWENFRYADGV